ncbi:MAG: RraA family protein [Pseudomonadota bacterium]
MIEDSILLEVRKTFPRPPKELLASFEGAATGNVVDAMGGRGALSHAIKPVNEHQSGFCGTALTCLAAPVDNLAVFAALDIAQPGDVIMIATDEHLSAAVIGDLMLGMAKNLGVHAVITDGSVRDKRGMEAVGLPCFSAGITPNSPVRMGPGNAGLPIIIGGTHVNSGDIVVGDVDGVVVVPAARAAEVAKQLAIVQAAEARLEAEVLAGKTMLDVVRPVLSSPAVRVLH